MRIFTDRTFVLMLFKLFREVVLHNTIARLLDQHHYIGIIAS
jgi:hypothetical protein